MSNDLTETIDVLTQKNTNMREETGYVPCEGLRAAKTFYQFKNISNQSKGKAVVYINIRRIQYLVCGLVYFFFIFVIRLLPHPPHFLFLFQLK